jgi:hypothetical protein
MSDQRRTVILVRSDYGDGEWSLHNPDATAEEQEWGEDIVLTGCSEWHDGWARPNAADYAEAERRLAAGVRDR